MTSPSYRNVLVPLDGSDLAAGALPTATALAKRLGAVVQTIGVAGPDLGTDELRRATADALGIGPDEPRIYVVTWDDVPAAIDARAAELDPCLVCMSTHGRGRVAGTVMGSVARDVIERGRAPVVVVGPRVADPDPSGAVPPPAPFESDRLVACVDGTPASEQVLPLAADWARALDLRLTALTVAEPCPPPNRIGAAWRRHHGPDTDVDEYLEALADRWAREAPGLATEVVYDPIGPAEGLKAHLAEHPAGLVAVASHLRTGLDRMVFGAAAADIVHVATAPTLIVPIST